MKQSLQDKLAKKRLALVERTAKALGTDETVARELLLTDRRQSVRLNPLVAPVQETLDKMRSLGWQGEPVAWMENGYTIEGGGEELRDSRLAADGALLIQNAASWLPVLALGAQPGEKVLDVCAAPG